MQNPERILFIYYKLFRPGGVAKALVNLANSLSEEGYGVEILLFSHEKGSFYPLNESIKVHYLDMFDHWAWRVCEFNVQHLRFIPKIHNINAYISHIGVYLLLRNWLKKNHREYGTLVSSWYKLSTFLALNPKVNFKTIAWEHVDHRIGGVFYGNLRRLFYRNLKGIVCLYSEAVVYYKKFNTTILIPNIIGEPFESIKPKLAQKEDLISFVGRLDEEKNVIDILEVFSRVGGQGWKLQIIGDGPQRKDLEHYIKEKKLAEKVILYGNKTAAEVASLLLKSKIFVFTSLKEALPTVLIEAKFCGNAIVAYDCDFGPRNILTPDTGHLIPMWNRKVLTSKVQDLIDNPIELNTKMQNALVANDRWRKQNILKNWELRLSPQ